MTSRSSERISRECSSSVAATNVVYPEMSAIAMYPVAVVTTGLSLAARHAMATLPDAVGPRAV